MFSKVSRIVLLFFLLFLKYFYYIFMLSKHVVFISMCSVYQNAYQKVKKE